MEKTIGLYIDETGEFENPQGLYPAITALVYMGEGDKLEQELFQLKSCFIKIGRDNQLEYPKHFHCNEIERYKRGKKRIRKKVQQELLRYLGGSRVWVLTGIINGKRSTDTEFTDPGKAANLYKGMLRRLIENTLYYSPLYGHFSEVFVKVAYRVVSLTKGIEKARIKTFERMGYYAKDVAGNKVIFRTVDQGVIEEIMREIFNKYLHEQENRKKFLRTVNVTGHQKKIIDVVDMSKLANGNVPSISLQNYALIGADWLANWFGLELHEHDCQPVQTVESILTKAKASGLPCFLWSYDNADDIWRKAMDAQKEKDLYGLYGQWDYLLKQQANNGYHSFYNYYANHWPLDNTGLVNDPDVVSSCLRKIELELRTTGSDIDYIKLLGVAELLAKEIPSGSHDSRDKENLLDLYDLLLQLYNHTGEVKKSFAAADKALQVLDTLTPESTFVRRRADIINKKAVAETNRFNFSGAEQILKPEIERFSERLLRSSDNSDNVPPDRRLGELWGTLGQSQAFLGKFDSALNSFKQALYHFENYNYEKERTYCYILKLAVVNNNRPLWDEYCDLYYEAGDVIEKLKGILENSKPNPYALKVLLSAIPVFYPDQLKQTSGVIENMGFSNFLETKSHPWELIYRYLVKINYLAGKKEQAKKYLSIMKDYGLFNLPADQSVTIRIINEGTILLAVSYEGTDREKDEALIRFINKIKQIANAPGLETIIDSQGINGWFAPAFHDVEKMDNVEQKIERVLQCFTFFYA